MSATYAKWLDTFQEAYASPNDVSSLPCPNCGNCALKLSFVMYIAGAPEGHGAFWCDSCLTGIAAGPCTVPSGGVRVNHDTAGVPRFQIVPPPGRTSASSR
jgi:hypothetical protein